LELGVLVLGLGVGYGVGVEVGLPHLSVAVGLQKSLEPDDEAVQPFEQSRY